VRRRRRRPLTGDGGPQSHEDHGGHRIPQAHRAAEVRGQVADDGRQHADDDDGGDEARPAVPVVGGWDEGEQHLPEDGQHVQEVVTAVGRPLLLPVVPVAWKVKG